jgi:hypothetical protein
MAEHLGVVPIAVVGLARQPIAAESVIMVGSDKLERFTVLVF